MMKKENISLSIGTKQQKVVSFFTAAGFVLLTNVLTTTSAHARYRIAPVEVVVYQGQPIDYSGRSDVIVIEDPSFNDNSTVIVAAPVYATESMAQPNKVAQSAAPKALQKAQNKQQLAQKTKIQAQQAKLQAQLAQRAKKQAQQAKLQAQLAQRAKKQAQQAKLQAQLAQRAKKQAQQAKLQAQLAHRAKYQAQQARLQARLKAQLAQQAKKQTQQARLKAQLAQLAKEQAQQAKLKAQLAQRAIIQAKQRARVQAIQTKKASVTNIAAKPERPKAKGKDPQLVAFYVAVFKKQKFNSSKKYQPAKTLLAKNISTKKVAQKKGNPGLKFKPVDLAKKIFKGKDPELVAFYKLVFSDGKYNTKKQNPISIAMDKGKDPELVAFYKLVFGKDASKTKLPVLAKKRSNKIKLATNLKPGKMHSATKVKAKTKKPMSTAAFEIQRLIDELSSRNII